MKNRKNFLVYCGNPGIGKTHFCAAVYEWALSNFSTVRYWNESDLLKSVRTCMEQFKGDYLDSLKYLIDDEFLIVDDIGSSGLNDWREEVLFKVIDERYNSTKPTIFTSNFSIKEFKNAFHPRVCSRLFAKENTIIEILNGEDLRA